MAQPYSSESPFPVGTTALGAGWRAVVRQFSREVVSRRAALQGAGVAVLIGFTNPLAMSLTEILLGVMAGCWILTGRYGERLRAIGRNPVALAALAMLGLWTVSVFYGEAAFSESVPVWAKYRNLVYLVLFATVFQTPRIREAGLLAFSAAMILTLAGSFLTAAGVPLWESRYTLNPADATVFRNHVVHGLCMGFFAYLMAHRFVDAPRWRWLTGPLALLAAGNALFMVAGRTGYVTLAALIPLFCLQRLRLRYTAVVIALAGAVVVVGYFHSDTFSTRVRDADAEVRAYLDYRFGDGPLKPEGWRRPVNRTSCGVRLEWYCAGLRLFAQRPWLGVGVGNIQHHLEAHAETTGVRPVHNLHSEYVLAAAQNGVLGIGMFATLFLAYWWASRRLSPKMRHVAQGMLAMALVAGVANSIIPERTEGVLFAFFSGLAFSELGDRALRGRAKHAEDSEPAVDEEPPQALARAA